MFQVVCRLIDFGREEQLREKMRLLYVQLRRFRGLFFISDEEDFRKLSSCSGFEIILEVVDCDSEGNLVFRYVSFWRSSEAEAKMAGLLLFCLRIYKSKVR